ncbi:hypothetical protein CHH91_04615 [Virgibacillus sp. 7505]|uniref:hypothetical protein n=1 Tax=Virgibacillus sp. 7505 TaxID=2022548 RepID=UPI000BA6A7E2|nr:hypothetical protein [Virgibacillus sp. 7505]PAE17292.1 hypothetical protein CHH91_04615 [Virgibacillus sp. 7505]
MATVDPIHIPFGLSDILIGEGADAIKFDGKDNYQAEGGELSLTPSFEDIVIQDFGTGVYDQRLVGWEGTVTITASHQSIKMLQLALAATEEITDAESGELTGLMDSKMGTSIRTKGKKVTIHPRQYAVDYKDMDITIYKMASNGEMARTFGNEQGNVTIELTMFVRDNADANKPGNYFYIGGTDPNASETPAA